ncbi:S8 family peptidase [Mycolicibacterium brisbanense]|uniref:Peptidase S8 and S53, subtilisin, kexin, sedolisin n=1 Tax=Mycolicibacterium brisbanense TaxID=146020 RepID=A0A100W1X2_9MYCO|nr:S8 family peptidase [Mycolicibacterium brisbanense]MCV7157497.1 S8 family peptidase [Mycolicibacterium brisbanense]GAS90133.1 peptidase S8 and S53, subtilisin, kexin, sedolisin [Mycolicibacterium brisbanense]
MTTADDPWPDRVHCALGHLDSLEMPADPQHIREAVAARFASRFTAQDRPCVDGSPRWHGEVDRAVDQLLGAGVVAPTAQAVQLTATGRDGVDDACASALATDERALPAASATPSAGPGRDALLAGVITPPLRAKFVVPPGGDAAAARDALWPVMIELNLRYADGTAAAIRRVRDLWRLVDGAGVPVPVAGQYLVGDLTTGQIEGLVSADAVPQRWPARAVYRIWPDFDTHPLIDASAATIKAIPAQRAFDSFGDGIVWAVVDSGIAADHPHFIGHQTLSDPAVADLHRDFTAGEQVASALIDDDGHGTHVAGIIAGGLVGFKPEDVYVAEKRFNVGSPEGDDPILQQRTVTDVSKLAGMAPLAKLVSLKVLGPGDQTSRVSRVMRALDYVRDVNAQSERMPRIHGVNLSLGYEFAAEWFACGQSPLCLEVDKTVRSGVVVVVASGNTGYVSLNPLFASDVTKFSADMTINDPGNAERAITVGATHRDAPHTYGVSYFSSKGPTGDGRRKPDLVAPGERITSAAAGKNRISVQQQTEAPIADGVALYVEASGTSMAAPHVSGAIAAFLSVQRELIGKPEDIKRIFVESATSLGRDPAFEGGGLVDLLRALQSV